MGIPALRDRVVQAAALLILEPIFEADFLDSSYGFRPGRSAHDALAEIRGHLQAGYQAVYDADLKGDFDSIPQDKLEACLRMRIADRSVLSLIRSWLNAPVEEPPAKPGGGKRITWPRSGTPQGGVISPLLANLYLHWFDKVFHAANGPATWAKAKLVRYADDFVVLARDQSPALRTFIETKLETWMGLEINREKTRAVGRLRETLRQQTSSRQCYVPLPALVETLNRQLIGWANYFRFGYPRHAFRQINPYTRHRLTVHVRRRSQRPFRPPEGVTYYGHFKRMGLVYLSDTTVQLPVHAQGDSRGESRMREIRTSGSRRGG